MLKFIYSKLTPALLIIVIFLTSSFFFVAPKKVEAQWAVIDGANLVQNTLIALNTSAQTVSSYSLQLKEYVLDGLGLLIAKQIIRQMTTSLVNWINNGFEGSPSFMQNPGAFFLDVADQITGDFIAKYGGPLQDLCTPFSIDIRLALAFKYRPNTYQRYTCTLSTIIKNTQNAVEGASINGFTAGDFRQGGWPAFVSLTTEPQNNVYGAYLTAESELSIRVANAEMEKRSELGAGRGFLSWRDPKCRAQVKQHNEEVKSNLQRLEEAGADEYRSTSGEVSREAVAENFEDLENATGENFSRVSNRVGGDLTQQSIKGLDECPIQTPGSVIESQLQHSLGGPLRELELADEINEVVNALFAQLVTQVLQKGLGTVTGGGAGDSGSYISQIQAEANAVNGTQNFEERRESLLSNMDTFIQNTVQYKTHKDSSLNEITLAKNNYDKVISCYEGKINSERIDDDDRTEAHERIRELDSIVNTEVAPIAARQLTAAGEAKNRLDTLNGIKTAALNARTLNELLTPSQEYSLLLQQQRLTDIRAVVEAEQELNSVRSQTASMNEKSAILLRECELFPSVRR